MRIFRSLFENFGIMKRLLPPGLFNHPGEVGPSASRSRNPCPLRSPPKDSFIAACRSVLPSAS